MTTEHQRVLRQQLLEAANRKADERKRRLEVQRKLVAAAVICAIAVTAAGIGVVLNSRPASADVFVVTEEGDAIVVSVDGAIKSPEEATRELREHGIDARLIARPTPPSLEGHLVGGSSVSGILDMESDGARVVRFRIPKSHDGEISLEYGREAEADELYLASEPPPDCENYSGLSLTDERIADIASRYGPNIVWQEWGQTVETGVRRDQLDSEAKIVSIVPFSADTVLIAVTDGSQPPPGSDC